MTTEPAPTAGGGSKSEKKKEKGRPKDLVIPPKKPKLTKAERRALQEEQRAAKAAGGGKKGGGNGGQKQAGAAAGGAAALAPAAKAAATPAATAIATAPPGAAAAATPMDNSLPLFSHLPPYRDQRYFEEEFSGAALGGSSSAAPPDAPPASAAASASISASASEDRGLHPEVLSLGMRYATGQVRGGNARARAMLRAFQAVIRGYRSGAAAGGGDGEGAGGEGGTGKRQGTGRGKGKVDVRQDLDHALKASFQHWTGRCRPHSVSMGNAFTFLKLAVASLQRDVEPEGAREVLTDAIDDYVHERIELAGRAIARHAASKIVDGDVVLTHGCSSVVEVVLTEAASGADARRFRVIVVDSRPLLEGRALVERLAGRGIECTYLLLNALPYVMTREVTKVFLGAASLLSNGSVLSRVGTAGVALVARSNNVPVLVCCETYKIGQRVQLESITGNELGNPDDVTSTDRAARPGGQDLGGAGGGGKGGDGVLADWREVPNLKVLNLLYDLTPSEFVSGIVTEMGILPPTSVAVLLRELTPQRTFL